MLVPINIDASEFAASFDISMDEIKQFTSNIISELATEFAMHWNKAANSLELSRQEYQNSIYLNKIDDNNYEVGLNGWLPNAIEQGISGFDEKFGFKSSSKVHMSQDGGWYLTIPFRHAVPGAGKSSLFSGTMPSEVYEEAKKLDVDEGLNVKNLPKELQVKRVRKKVITESKIFKEYQNKYSIYAGIQRKRDTTGRGTYFSFRRVSDKSDDNSWIHPGIQARKLAEKALSTMNIKATVDNLANKYIEQL